MTLIDRTCPPLHVSQWLNAPHPLTLEGLRGRVVVLHAFQMLCPGCVSHGLPQAVRIHGLFPLEQVVVIGLHTVFEHHDVTGPEALRVFLREYRIPFPVAIDQPGPTGPEPMTMQALSLRGTPSLVILDRKGRVRVNHFGQVDDLQLGAIIGQLLAEAPAQLAVDAVDPRAADPAGPPRGCTPVTAPAPPRRAGDPPPRSSRPGPAG